MENTKKKKLLIFLHKFPYPDIDSTKFRILNSIILPLKKYFDIKILIVTYEKIKKEDLDFLKNIAHLDFFIFSKWRFILNILLNSLSLRPFQTEMFFFKKVFLKFKEEAEESEVIYIHTVRLGKYIEKLKLELKNKIIFDFNDSIAMHYLNGWKYYPLLLKIPVLIEGLKLYFYEKKIFKILNRFSIVSNLDKKFIIKKISDNIIKEKKFIVTYTSVKINNLKEKQNENINNVSPYICFIGNLKYYPNYEGLSYFLKYIWPNVKEKLNYLDFFIIGQVSKKIQNKFKDIKGVKFLGFVENPYPVLKNSLAIISPVRIGAGIQGKVIEAMSIGKIIISFYRGVNKVDGFNHFENILICKKNNWKNWLKYFKIVLNNKKIVNKIEKNSIKLVLKKFSSEAVFQKYLELFNDFI